MLHILQSSIFSSPAQTLVNTVNTVGVMGKGIAQAFKARYPEMFREYRDLCDKHILTIGTLHCWHGPDRWVLNFPTKTTWKKPSKLEYVEQGLITFKQNYKTMGIQSISFPPLGCGNGQLNWQDVRPMMLKYLWNIDIPVFIHEWFEAPSVAEQHDHRAKLAPATYSEFLSDLHATIDERRGQFHTFARQIPYRVTFSEESDLEIYLDRKFVIPQDIISTAWAGLQVGLLTAQTLGGELEKYARYLLPVLASLAYVQKVVVQFDPQNAQQKSVGLFLGQHVTGYEKFNLVERENNQRWLFR